MVSQGRAGGLRQLAHALARLAKGQLGAAVMDWRANISEVQMKMLATKLGQAGIDLENTRSQFGAEVRIGVMCMCHLGCMCSVCV